jgi:plastocyanin
MTLSRLFSACLLVLSATVAGGHIASAESGITVTIKDHKFDPAEIHVPAGKPAVLTIKNEDGSVEEFDSSALKVEKVIAGGGEGSVRLRPLDPGRYPFMGEYHAETAQGVVIAE